MRRKTCHNIKYFYNINTKSFAGRGGEDGHPAEGRGDADRPGGAQGEVTRHHRRDARVQGLREPAQGPRQQKVSFRYFVPKQNNCFDSDIDSDNTILNIMYIFINLQNF